MKEQTPHLVKSSAKGEPALVAEGGDEFAGVAPPSQPETVASLGEVNATTAVIQGPKSRAQNGNVRRETSGAKWTAERRRARCAAVQALYEIDCTQHRPGVALQYRQEEELFSPESLAFLYWLVSGVLSYQAELDQLIGRYAPEWPVHQLAIVDRNVLRLSIFELTSPDADAPPKVVINEAVELAKTFGSDSSSRFVNGVLGTALREISQPSVPPKGHQQVSR